MRIGVDVGGTKIEAIALDGERVLARRRVPAPRDDYRATLCAVRDLVAAVAQETAQSGTVGVGIPGTISAETGLVKNANSVWLIGRPFDRDLARAIGQEVRVANDANCFALSEATDGAGRGARVVFGVIVGTGTGGGIVVDGRVLEGRHRIAGEWGHNPLPWPEPADLPGVPCYCGRSGCIETVLSGPGLSRTYAALAGEPGREAAPGDGVPASRVPRAAAARGARREAPGAGQVGSPARQPRWGARGAPATEIRREAARGDGPPRLKDAAEVAARADAGEAAADSALQIYEGRMARALASVINVLDPDIIVVGGGLSNIERLYTNVPARWGPYVFSDHADTPLVKAAHGDSSGVRGAAWLW
ncbi:MAG TPA: ROK family protein [Vicinamibacterales bacterium]|nr:ROK family protein [Vicinamibacterales bacterium]